MVQSTIVYGVNLFNMPGMQRVVYAKSLKILTATSCCLLLIATNRIKLLIRQLLISLKRFSGMRHVVYMLEYTIASPCLNLCCNHLLYTT